MSNSRSTGVRQSLSPARFHNLLSDRLFLMDYEVVAETAGSMSRFAGIRLGAIDVSRHDGFGLHRSTRRPHHIRADKVDDYLVHLPLCGRTRVLQSGMSVGVEPGEFVIMATTTPLEGVISAASGRDVFSCYQARISASEMRMRIPLIDRYCDQSIKIRQGSGKMMLPLFDLVLRDGGYLPEGQSRHLGAVLIDMVANSVAEAPELDAGRNLAEQSSPQRILDKARAYIESHLSDPELNVRRIAENCNVSLRSLQNAFASSSMTITASILEGRLLHCRAALKNLSLRDQPVTRIAMTWGFGSSSYFSQVYKDRFGIAPGADRRQRDKNSR